MCSSRRRGYSEFSQYPGRAAHEQNRVGIEEACPLHPSGDFLLAAAFAGLATGCAIGPAWHAPQPPPGADYSPAALTQSSVSAPIHGGETQRFWQGRDVPFDWWCWFESPALNALIDKAFKANPSIKSAQATLAQAQQLVYAQQGFFY